MVQYRCLDDHIASIFIAMKSSSLIWIHILQSRDQWQFLVNAIKLLATHGCISEAHLQNDKPFHKCHTEVFSVCLQWKSKHCATFPSVTCDFSIMSAHSHELALDKTPWIFYCTHHTSKAKLQSRCYAYPSICWKLWYYLLPFYAAHTKNLETFPNTIYKQQLHFFVWYNKIPPSKKFHFLCGVKIHN